MQGDGVSRLLSSRMGPRVSASVSVETRWDSKRARLASYISKIASFPKRIDSAPRVRALASLPVPILLSGERGSGRSQVARAIHASSGLADQPLVHWVEGEVELPDRSCVLVIEDIERLPHHEQERWLHELCGGAALW